MPSKPIFLVKEVWWQIKDYLFRNKYWKHQFQPTLRCIEKDFCQYYLSSNVAVKSIISMSPDISSEEVWGYGKFILLRTNFQNLYKYRNLKQVPLNSRPVDLKVGMEVDEYHYRILTYNQWQNSSIRWYSEGRFSVQLYNIISGLSWCEIAFTKLHYAARRNDIPIWEQNSEANYELGTQRMIHDINILGGNIIPTHSTSFEKRYLNYKTWRAFQDYSWVDDVHRDFFDAEDHAEWLADF